MGLVKKRVPHDMYGIIFLHMISVSVPGEYTTLVHDTAPSAADGWHCSRWVNIIQSVALRDKTHEQSTQTLIPVHNLGTADDISIAKVTRLFCR